jgi:hypothetical protein
MQENIKIYKSLKIKQIELPDYDNLDYKEMRREQGFKQIGFLEPFTFNIKGIPYVEINWYKNKDNESIIEFWDCNECLFAFFCEDEMQTLELLERFMKMASLALDIELKHKKIQES